jgi:DNA-binding NarL/FixJ family response regulator
VSGPWLVFKRECATTSAQGVNVRMSIHILMVDDFEPWRCFVYSILQKNPELQIIGEVSDGITAVREAEELKPDVILLDIGLPKLNGIAAAGKIRDVAPNAKVLFLSQDSSADVVREALKIGAGFILKADAYRELLPAISAVILGSQFVSSGLKSHTFRRLPSTPQLK